MISRLLSVFVFLLLLSCIYFVHLTLLCMNTFDIINMQARLLNKAVYHCKVHWTVKPPHITLKFQLIPGQYLVSTLWESIPHNDVILLLIEMWRQWAGKLIMYRLPIAKLKKKIIWKNKQLRHPINLPKMKIHLLFTKKKFVILFHQSNVRQMYV